MARRKLFQPTKQGYDSLNRIVFICDDKDGSYVYKPGSGFRSRHYSKDEAETLNACFERQIACGHTHAFYEQDEKPLEDETYPLIEIPQ